MRYFLRFSYDGTTFHGSQRQPNGITVQETMENAMTMLFRQDIDLTFAGRTDAGVHAREMFAHFDLSVPADSEADSATLPANLVFRLNGILPDSIAIYDVIPVKDDAHARFSACKRTYEYHLVDHKDPFSCHFATRVRPGLNFEAMNLAAQHLLGCQDFASFCRSNTDVKTTICDLSHAQWTFSSDGHAVFTISADRFLRNMVRAIVGTLFLVGRGKISVDEFAAVITAQSRSAAGESAPAAGLYLTSIEYPAEIYVDEDR